MELNSKCPPTRRIIQLYFVLFPPFFLVTISLSHLCAPFWPPLHIFPFLFLRWVDQINKYSCKKLIDFQMQRGACAIRRYYANLLPADCSVTKHGLFMMRSSGRLIANTRGSTCQQVKLPIREVNYARLNLNPTYQIRRRQTAAAHGWRCGIYLRGGGKSAEPHLRSEWALFVREPDLLIPVCVCAGVCVCLILPHRLLGAILINLLFVRSD